MTRTTLFTGNAPKPIGPYSQAIIYDNLLFVSGQGPIDPAANSVFGATIEKHTR